MTWADLNGALKQRGVLVGGSYGRYSGVLFRIGHMGEQARIDLVDATVDALADALAELGVRIP